MIIKTNIRDKGWQETSHGEKYQRAALNLTNVKDDNLLGCTAYSVKPGKRAFPKHGHLVNDEAIYVLSGTGNIAVGDDSGGIGPGDFIWLSRGSKHAHIVINDGEENLVYLCISTNIMPDIVHYPNSDKLGVLESKNFWAGGEKDISGFYNKTPVDYYDGEE